MKTKKRKLWKTLAVTFGVLALLLLLFVVAFVFNPLEGSLRDVRDAVPREVDFFLRKERLAGDFTGPDGRLHLSRDELPAPAFWTALTDTEGWRDLQRGALVSGMKRDYEGVLRQARDGLVQFEQNSGGMLDLARDLIGHEVVVAGYFEDKTKQPTQPLVQPWWCTYARVGWRMRAAWGLARWPLVQGQAKAQGVDIQNDGELIAIKLPGAPETLYAARRLDCLMLGNSKHLLEQSLRLIDGNVQEEPFGTAARYADGIAKPIQHWAEINSDAPPNALEFSAAPNSIDGFRRVAMTWPNENNKDSMNERVLASFLKLSGWNTLSGALLFEPSRLSVLGEVVLNSHMHTKFQQSFYKAEKQDRKEWLDPFLRMVPDNACAAAGLRVPVGEFLRAMYGALLPNEKTLLNDQLRQCSFQNQQLAETGDLIDRLSIAFLPRTGFVFRRNVRDQQIPVTAVSPVPQIAWIFWIRPGSKAVAEEFVEMLRKHAGAFSFNPVYHLKVDELPEPVTEFCNPQIPGTGELAMIVFSEFFVLSNSGPLIKDILRTRYNSGNARSLVGGDAYQRIQGELPKELNGFIWLRGQNLIPVLDDYRTASVQQNQDPDPAWMMDNRSSGEQAVLRARYPNYATLASMPKDLREGEFAEAVTAYLREQWGKVGGGLSAADLPQIDQLKSMAKLLDAAYLQLELENNYIRFQGKLMTNF